MGGDRKTPSPRFARGGYKAHDARIKAMKSTGAKAGKPLVGSSAAQAKRKLAIAKLKKGVKGPIERSSFSKAMAHREKAMFSKKGKKAR